MTDDELLDESPEELFEDAPCGYVTTRLDGTIVRVNRTFERWTGLARDDLLAKRRFQDLLTAGGRIYHETHVSPLLQMQGSVNEIACEILRGDGSRLPSLVNASVRNDAAGEPRLIRRTVFDATDRRRYEQELLRSRDRERDVALELQRSLLSGALPGDPRLDLGVVYRAGVRGLEVGGDWYDAVWLREPDEVALVVGDVVGRGIGAAATMGQLRSAIRALAATGLGPAALLEALDRYAAAHAVGRMTTLAYVQLDLATGRARYACAGHPPPAVVLPGGDARYAWDGRSLPLDAFGTAPPRPEGELVLTPGETLVLYTDGLVERRDQTLVDGMDALLETIGGVDATAQGTADAAVRELAGREHTSDDVCVLAARYAQPERTFS